MTVTSSSLIKAAGAAAAVAGAIFIAVQINHPPLRQLHHRDHPVGGTRVAPRS